MEIRYNSAGTPMRLSPVFLRAALLLCILLSVVWALWGPSEVIGASLVSIDGKTQVAAGTTPEAAAAGVALLLIYCLLLNTRIEQREFRIAPIWRRAAAFVLDIWVVLYGLAALFAIIPLLLEAHRTGIFRWAFRRDYGVASDWVIAPIVLLCLVGMVSYFLLPLMRRGQTLGGWIFRVATVNSDGYTVKLPFSTALRRLHSQFRGLMSPLKTLRTKDEQGRTFYDTESGFTVISY